MTNFQIIKRLYKTYTKNYLNKILISVFFSLLVAGSTSAIAWLLDPAIEKIFIEKDQRLILIIPAFIILAFATKGLSMYLAYYISNNNLSNTQTTPSQCPHCNKNRSCPHCVHNGGCPYTKTVKFS